MGAREDAQIIQLLSAIREQNRDFYSSQLKESRQQNAILAKVLKKLSTGGGPKPVDPAVRGKFVFLDDNGQETVGKMKLKANFKGSKKFRVSFFDAMEGGNAADVEKLELSQLNPDLGLLIAKMDRVSVGVYEGEMSILGKAGLSQLIIDADGDLSDGEVKIHVVSEEIEILPADAVLGKFEFLADEVPAPVPVPEPVPEPVPAPEPVPVDPPLTASMGKKAAPKRAGASR